MSPPADLTLESRAPRARFGFALGAAVVLHAVILLTIDFMPDHEPRSRASIDITFVEHPTPADVEDAEQYAQSDHEGDEPTAEPQSSPEVRAEALSRGPDAPTSDTTALSPAGTVIPRVEPLAEQPEPTPEDVADSAPEVMDAPRELVHARTLEPPQQPSAAQLIQSGLAAARTSERPGPDALRRTYITSRTQEHVYASYMDAWRRKVEQVGNMNYPQKARKEGLYGSLILDVAVNADGSVREINLRRSSGHPELDEAARRIVNLAAPFAPLPDSIREHTDVLHITRTWQFRQDNQLRGR